MHSNLSSNFRRKHQKTSRWLWLQTTENNYKKFISKQLPFLKYKEKKILYDLIEKCSGKWKSEWGSTVDYWFLPEYTSLCPHFLPTVLYFHEDYWILTWLLPCLKGISSIILAWDLQFKAIFIQYTIIEK